MLLRKAIVVVWVKRRSVTSRFRDGTDLPDIRKRSRRERRRHAQEAVGSPVRLPDLLEDGGVFRLIGIDEWIQDKIPGQRAEGDGGEACGCSRSDAEV